MNLNDTVAKPSVPFCLDFGCIVVIEMRHNLPTEAYLETTTCLTTKIPTVKPTCIYLELSCIVISKIQLKMQQLKGMYLALIQKGLNSIVNSAQDCHWSLKLIWIKDN